MEPTRETFGNIPFSSQVVFYVLFAVSLSIFMYGVWRRFKLWRKGFPIQFRKLISGSIQQISRNIRPGIQRLITEGLGQKRVRGRGLPTYAHLLLFSGFMMLFLGTTLLEIDHIAEFFSKSLKFHHGLYYVIYEYTLDIFGLLFLLGCFFFLWRRTHKPSSVGHRTTDWSVLALFIAIGITGYLIEGLRMVWQKPTGIAAYCSPVGFFLSQFFSNWSETQARQWHFGIWWSHSLLVFGFLASIPYTRLMHTITGPLNLFFSHPSLGKLTPVSMEDVEKYERVGVSEIQHFHQQQLLSLDACMECGRCEEACPAFATQKPLSPKKVVQDLKGLMTEKGERPESSKKLHGDTITLETLLSCTSCSACTNICPVRVDPLGLIFDLRRNQVSEGALSGTSATALRRMQSSANPWGLPPTDRSVWSEGLGAPTCSENPSFEILYWIGCAGSYDRRAQRVAKSMVKLLKHAGVNFAILGKEEKCTGESARRLGDEFLFQELATANIETLSKYKVSKIVAHCPHCLNSLLNDYSQFGGHYEVIHHSQFLEQLIQSGRLKIPPADKSTLSGKITYHDPCYLARVHGIHEAPRQVLKTALGCGKGCHSENHFVEIPRNRTKTSCCGAGGGRMWMEEEPKKRVSTQRSAEALATGAQTVAVGCPFCMTMMTDGVAANQSEAKVMDLSEILCEKMGLTEPK